MNTTRSTRSLAYALQHQANRGRDTERGEADLAPSMSSHDPGAKATPHRARARGLEAAL